MDNAHALMQDPELLSTAWDLEPLIAAADGRSSGEPATSEVAIGRLLDQALTRADAFANAYTGKLAELDGAGLITAMRELAAISDLVGRAGSYVSLRFAEDTADERRGALLAQVQERATALQTRLLAFELEWAALPDATAEQLLGTDGLEFCAHYLRSERRYRPHLLTEPEERILTEKALSSRSAWGRLFGELVAGLRVSLGGESVALELALSRLQSADRTARSEAAEAVSAALEPGIRTRATIFNTLIYDKSVEDRLRGYPHWLAARNLDNEASDGSVMALIDAVHGRHDIPQRWYRLKARLLGLDQLADYDRSAPLAQTDTLYPFARARELVLSTYEAFSPQAGAVTRRFFTEHWIDAPVRENKRGGAFCSYTVPSVHPYVMLNYTARRRDVLTMAHELGHGLHSALAQQQGIFHQGTPLTLAETASVFGETLVFERLLAEAASDSERLDLLAERIDGTIATVFRQIAMNRFEHLVHSQRRQQGELAVEDFGAAWLRSQREMFGDSLALGDGYQLWWSYIPHFIDTPGYVYAYAYGQLLALSVYGRYQQEGEQFAPRYLELLAAGGSRAPEQLAEIVGIDLTDPGFWSAGLALIDDQLKAAEELADGS